MTRRFLDDIKEDIAQLWPNNITGAISPADLRGPVLDMVDSLKQDECELEGSAPTVGLALTGTFVSLTTVFDGESGGDGVFLKPDFANGVIVGATTAGFSYLITGDITVEANNNETIELVVGVNGVPTGFIGALTGNSNNDLSVSISHFVRTSESDAVYTLMARAADGAATIDIQEASMIAIIWPTNNP